MAGATIGPQLPRTPFPHPYQPYRIQDELMQHVYRAVHDSKVAVVESPTGTVR
jgi:chromosome transmission fidelity protein 1